MVVVVMGVCGSGKSTIGAMVAQQLRWEFVEGDRYHSAENIARMSRGEALSDEDRGPWLEALAREIGRCSAEGGRAVVACSALKRAYRAVLRRGADRVLWVHLVAPREVLRERMERRDHFMGAGMLESQLAVLEPPDGADPDVLVVNVAERGAAEAAGDIAAWVLETA